MRERVVDGQFSAAAAFFGGGRRNHLVHQVHGRFAQDAGGLAVGVEVDGSALRRHGFAGDAGGGQRGRVGDGNVPVDAIEKCRVSCRDLVEILAGGQDLFFPQRVVPAAAGDPVAFGRFSRESLDLCQHLGQRLDPDQVEIELGLAGPAEMGVGVVESGKDEGAGGTRGRAGGCSVLPAA